MPLRRTYCATCRTRLPEFGPTGLRKRRDTKYCDDCNKKRQSARVKSWTDRQDNYMKRYKLERYQNERQQSQTGEAA